MNRGIDWRATVRYAISDGVPRSALVVALVIGSVLNIVNQGDAILGDGSINWIKVALTFAVPYCVSTYGAVTFRLRAARDVGEGDPPGKFL